MIAEGVTLHDVAAMAAHLPRDSASMVSLYPPSEWDSWFDPAFGGGAAVMLAAHQADLLALANWQRTMRQSGKPRPLKRPTRPSTATSEDGFDSGADWHAWYRQQQGGRDT